MTHPQKPGEKPQHPGRYQETDQGGRPLRRSPREVNMEPGDTPLPPTRKPGRKWVPKRGRA